MSASLENEPDSSSAEPVLTPKLSAAWALRLSHVLIACGWVLFFLIFSYMPLRGTDLWGHTLLGRWIIEHRELPAEDPYFTLAQGMPVVDSAWLAQVCFAFVEQHSGANGLAILFASLSLLTLLVLARTFFLQSQRLLPMMVGVVSVVIVGWSRATTLRPESFGALLFALLLWLVTGAEQQRTAAESSSALAKLRTRLLPWLGVPIIFCLWANFHGSYICGLLFLACCAVGQAIDVAWSKRSLPSVFHDARVQQYAFLTEIALLATFINPYGLDLLVYNLRFSQNTNLASILEWQPIVILGIGGIEFMLSWVLLLFAWRQSRAPVTATQVLLLAAFALLSIKSMRMIGWYAPVFAWVITPHIAEIWSRYWPAGERQSYEPVDGKYVIPAGQSFHYTLIFALVVWLGFSFSPLGALVMGGKPRPQDKLFDQSSSPEKVTEFLIEHPPKGQVFHAPHWGDWFLVRVPSFQPFVTSNIHLAPPHVWEDYLRISNAQPGWQRVLDRYNVATLVLDKRSQPILVQAMKQNTGWKRTYDDDAAVVYERRETPASTDPELNPPPRAADEKPGDAEPEPTRSSP